MSVLQLYCDGGSRSNPGPSGLGAAGYHVNVDGQKQCIFEKGVFLENCSNNFAEYLALIHALNYAAKSDYNNIEVYSDSKLIVEQVNGRWKVKSNDLKDLANSAIDKVLEMKHAGRQVSVSWIPREKNVHADSLANLAMDRKSGAEYHRDINQAEKMHSLMVAMTEHEKLVNDLVNEPRRSKIRKLKDSYDKVKQAYESLHM